MIRRMKIIGTVTLFLLVLVLLIASNKPDQFRVERSLVVNAPADSIRGYITDFHQWILWSPYEAKEPTMPRTYEGPSSGTGSVYSWKGEQVGSGRMEILDVRPEKIMIKLDFSAPFEAHNTAEFLLEPQQNGTKVSWVMYGPNNFMSKVMGVFFSMDLMVGKDFEKGLQNLSLLAAEH